MKICAAQTKPVTGNVPLNIENHVALTNRAVAHGAELIVFPELSLTGYEPTLARQLATDGADARFEIFQQLSDSKSITISVGMPTKSATGICISMILFQPRTARRIYSKTYLHPDELPFFVAGNSSPDLLVNDTRLALAICYELSVPRHLATALKARPQIYLASVAKFARGMDQARATLSDTAKQNAMPVLMANSVGPADNGACCGKSSAWNNKGELVGQLDDSRAGILIFDTESEKFTAL